MKKNKDAKAAALFGRSGLKYRTMDKLKILEQFAVNIWPEDDREFEEEIK